MKFPIHLSYALSLGCLCILRTAFQSSFQNICLRVLLFTFKEKEELSEYELHLHNREVKPFPVRQVTSFQQFTLCLWLQTNASKFLIQYNVTLSNEMTAEAFGLVIQRKVQVAIMNQKRWVADNK